MLVRRWMLASICSVQVQCADGTLVVGQQRLCFGRCANMNKSVANSSIDREQHDPCLWFRTEDESFVPCCRFRCFRCSLDPAS